MERPRKLERTRKIRVAPDNPVRRRLFADSPDDVTAVENFNNAIKERFETEAYEMSKKYNYDFQNDRPHPFENGNYIWFINNDHELIGIKGRNAEHTLTEIDLNREAKNEAGYLKREHETTPKSFSQGDLPKIKKNKADDSMRGIVKKRRLSF